MADPRRSGDLDYEDESGTITVAFKKPEGLPARPCPAAAHSPTDGLRAIGELGNMAAERRSHRLLRDLGSGSGPARLGPGARRDAPTLRLPAVVIGVAHSWLASRRAPCEGRLERGLPSSK